MKSILIPTDFSPIANNAIAYAVEIAKLSEAKLILFHAYQLPVVSSDVDNIMPIEDFEKTIVLGLKKNVREIQQNYGVDLIVEYSSSLGIAEEEINRFAEENDVNLIVMGMEGANYLSEKIIGSTTTSLIKKATCPVLVIDKKVQYQSIKNIALACDYSKPNHKSTIKKLKEFTRLFNAKLHVINVVNEEELVPSSDEAAGGIRLEHLLEDVEHSSFYIKNNDVVDGINKFVDEESIDMLVMIPHRHTTLQNIFHEPNTKRMAFHTKVPLLTLH
ncbi:MAG: universal stress protein [Bacteroidetes bacterium]|nr:universal stress protein [Bacteroidota bacterium]